jgi:nucleoside 2-deoxyribosyltransferase
MIFFIASPWRNKEAVKALSETLTREGHTAMSFLTSGANLASGNSVNDELKEFARALVGWEDDPLVDKIFSSEIEGVKACDALILLEPSGRSSLAEAGIAYGLGKPVILVGRVDRPEMIYHVCKYRYPDPNAFIANLDEVGNGGQKKPA